MATVPKFNAGPDTKMLAIYTPLSLVKKLEKSAKDEHRSVSGLVVVLCQEALESRANAHKARKL
jgi:hypothetical protein